MDRVPLARPAIAVVLGVLLERAGLGCIALALAATAIAVRWNVARVGAAFALAAGVVGGALHGHPTLITQSQRTHAFACTVEDAIASEPWGDGFTCAGRYRVQTALRERVHAGERLVLRGRLDPLDEPRNPGEPSLRALGAERGIAGRLAFARLVRRDGDAPFAIVIRARAWALARLHAALPAPDDAILAGALLGERGALPHDVHAAFQDTGTVHVLVTAGLHLAAIAAIALWLATRCGLARIPASLVALAAIVVYTILSGAHLPSVRAAAMVGSGLLARALGQKAVSWNALALAAIVIALVSPVWIGSVSFALSFSCVAAILLFAEPIAKALQARRLPHVLAEPIALTLATQIGVWPLTAAVFLVFAPYAPLANLVVVPCIPLVLALGIALLAATPVPPLAAAIANLTTWVLALLVAVVTRVAAFPFAHVTMRPPEMWAIVLYDAGIIVAAHLAREKRPAIAAAIGVIACAVTFFHPPEPPALRITFLDVGQGDGAIVETPRGHVFAIDAGGRLERGVTADGSSPAEAIGERIVVPYLQRRGITRLDAIVLSHPHGDHVGGVAPIERAFPIGAFLDAGEPYGGHAYRDALAEAAAHHVAVHVPVPGETIHTDDGVELRILAPQRPLFADGRDDINENSIVLMLSYRGVRVLFTGDAGAQAEARLLASGVDLHADILKVGHHGSAYASTTAFIAAVRPRVAVISVGRDNLFGHPAPSTLDTLVAAGVRVYRTDRCGAVSMTITDRTTIETMLGC